MKESKAPKITWAITQKLHHSETKKKRPERGYFTHSINSASWRRLLMLQNKGENSYS